MSHFCASLLYNCLHVQEVSFLDMAIGGELKGCGLGKPYTSGYVKILVLQQVGRVSKCLSSQQVYSVLHFPK